MQCLLVEPVLAGNLHQPADSYGPHQIVDVVLVLGGAVILQAQGVWPDLSLYSREFPGRRAMAPSTLCSNLGVADYELQK